MLLDTNEYAFFAGMTGEEEHAAGVVGDLEPDAPGVAGIEARTVGRRGCGSRPRWVSLRT